MIQTNINSFDTVKLKGNRKQQCQRILDLFINKKFVSTALLRTIACQYNARIYELRHGLFDGVKHKIEKKIVEIAKKDKNSYIKLYNNSVYKIHSFVYYGGNSF